MSISDVYQTRRINLARLVRLRFDDNQATLATRIQRSPGQVSQWITGHRNITDGTRDLIERECQAEGWLDAIHLTAGANTQAANSASGTLTPSPMGEAHQTSQARPIVPPKHQEEPMRLTPPALGYVRLPILAEAAAGPGRTADTQELIEHVDVAEDWVRRTLRANPANLRVLTARGHSMAGQVEDGDAMFVTPCTQFVDDGLYIIAVGDLLRVKRLRLRVLDQVLSIESNDGSPAETLPVAQADEAIRICGRVVAAWALRKL